MTLYLDSIQVVGNLHLQTPIGYRIFFYFCNLYYLVLWITFTIGFGIYGYKLMKVMPQLLAYKIRNVSGIFCEKELIISDDVQTGLHSGSEYNQFGADHHRRGRLIFNIFDIF